ncbi:alkaline phosphatase [Phyllobacterium phragmitis]|uniref:Alkaline phosphatase n=1 Tax=Phyllobacterium phragmitis TaxID=2670329 RepID=A0A2S9IJG5_9HYPH|nr:alkaline phosphatase [Phyllobacterium phragmitis]PRD40658.1 alkaline phosphatase [Phyllobacterium phragmitis]
MTKQFAGLLFASVTAIFASTHNSTVFAQSKNADALFERAAKGNIAEAGGARRLKGDITAAFRDQIKDGPAKHVILLIGDGMGDSEITIARNYAVGAGNYFKGLDALPVTGQYTHYSIDKKTGKPSYVTDSAASGTAWASGVKTYNGAIGVDIHEKPHKTLLELARQAGFATGDVSTAEIQDATPAAQMAHVTHRKCYDPTSTAEKCGSNALENGGLGSISEQLLNTRPDLTLGGGAKYFEDKARAGEWKDQTLRTQAEARGYQLVGNLEELDKVTAANQDKPLLGLFTSGNMPVRWEGPKASHYGNIEKDPVKCKPNEKRSASTPTLAQMTEKAIDLLKTNEKGFFLQVESASIDKQDHAANPCGQIGETVALDEAVQVALDFARKDGNTLVIVTADHAHTSQIIDPDARAPGFTQALKTKDGAIMAVSYGTSTEPDHQGHTGTQLRVAAFGPGAANFSGLTDQTDMFYTIRDTLNLLSRASESGQNGAVARQPAQGAR